MSPVCSRSRWGSRAPPGQVLASRATLLPRQTAASGARCEAKISQNNCHRHPKSGVAEEGSARGQSQSHFTGVQGRAPRAPPSKCVEDGLGEPASAPPNRPPGDAMSEPRLDQTPGGSRWQGEGMPRHSQGSVPACSKPPGQIPAGATKPGDSGGLLHPQPLAAGTCPPLPLQPSPAPGRTAHSPPSAPQK